MLKGRLDKHFKELIRYNDNIMTCEEYYTALQQDGYTILEHFIYSDGVNSYRFKNSNDNLYEIPKMVYDYFASK